MLARTGAGHRYEKIAFLSSGAPEADASRDTLAAAYGNAPETEADVVVALGGDGLMLQTLHRFMDQETPIFGVNRGSVGFLMNDYRADNLLERLDVARPTTIHPLMMRVTDEQGEVRNARAVNEVSMLRQTYQAAKLRITIDGEERLGELVSDGVLVSTPAGSTAYNHSVGGPVVPLDFGLMAMSPISAFRPRRWPGALLSDTSRVVIDVLEHDKRPVSAVADHFEVRNVVKVEITMDHRIDLVLLHDVGHALDERLLRAQFRY